MYNSILSKSTDKYKINEVIVGTHLQNLEGERPTLTNTKPIPTGTQFTYRLPAGISLKEWIDRKYYFETFTSGTVDIFPPINAHITIQVHHNTFPDEIPFTHTEYPDMLAPLNLGLSMDGVPLIIDLSELPHLLIGGLPGYGKTSLLRSILVSLKLSNVEVFAIDRKRVDFPPLKQWVNVAETEEEALSIIRYLLEENTRRQLLLAEQGVTKIQDYKGDMKYITLIVDEGACIETPETYKGIDALVRLARATGISVILATQKPSAKLWEGNFSNTRDLMAGRISFYVADYVNSQMILGKGNTSACNLPMVKGRGIVVLGDNQKTVQTMYLSDVEAKEILFNLNYLPMTDLKPVEIIKKKVGRPKKRA